MLRHRFQVRSRESQCPPIALQRQNEWTASIASANNGIGDATTQTRARRGGALQKAGRGIPRERAYLEHTPPARRGRQRREEAALHRSGYHVGAAREETGRVRFYLSQEGPAFRGVRSAVVVQVRVDCILATARILLLFLFAGSEQPFARRRLCTAGRVSRSSHARIDDTLLARFRTRPKERIPAILALHHPLVAVGILAIGYQMSLPPARVTRSQLIVGNPPSHSPVEDVVDPLEHWLLGRRFFVKRAIVGDDAAREAGDVGEF
mmetsp:Transcript_28798/g.69357  ORF Transcript_28798/g.69357 Transcript_28798/m.69357 type:complete len:265 (-) Transcript_28798:159-953(-)